MCGPEVNNGRGGRRSRCLALFPGAFRPPHAAHVAAVRDLVGRTDIDEVVLIISNRARHIPGTTKALDADVARQIWSLYLRGIGKVRIEIAEHSAVRHALNFFDRVNPGDRLLFCIGEADLAKGDGRFADVGLIGKRKGVEAAVTATPTGSMQVRASALRESIAAGDAGRELFMSAMPSHLTPALREKVWRTSQDGLKEVSDIASERIRAVMARQSIGEIASLHPTGTGRLDPVFFAKMRDGRSLYIKYAGDTVGSGRIGHALSPKPRQRLAVEYRVLKFLRTHLPSEVLVPNTVAFDKPTRTLILTDVYPGASSLKHYLMVGILKPRAATAAGRFLARCHVRSSRMRTLWGEKETDLHHWKKMLALRTGDIDTSGLPSRIRRDLARLEKQSHEARQNRLVVLDFVPKNVLVADRGIGVIDLELSSSIGDPAYDLGIFVGHLIFWGICTSREKDYRAMLARVLESYQSEVSDGLWSHVRPRIAAFAGAGILSARDREYSVPAEWKHSRLIEVAENLLSTLSYGPHNVTHVLNEAMRTAS